MNRLYVEIKKFVRNKVDVLCGVLKREQTSRVHLVFGCNVVLHQDGDSMKRTALIFVSM